MKVIRCEGGLGNRLFQYALYKKISYQYIDAFLDDVSFIPYLGHDDLDLKFLFKNIEYNSWALDGKFRCETHYTFFDKVIRNFKEKYDRRYISEGAQTYKTNLIKNLPGNCYLRGYWQNEKYFSSIRKILLKELEFLPLSDQRNIDLSYRLNSEESVSIHFRKGSDYAGLKAFQNTCPIEYYKDAISYVNRTIPDAKYYVFSDNEVWVRENLKDLDYIFVNWNPNKGINTYVDMQLMSLCKHNIIANSSYSWWGAWLNRNPNKVVVAPKNWYNPDLKKETEIIPDSWIKF